MLSRKKRFAKNYDQTHQGLILFLVDQSASMSARVDDKSKAEIAASCVNRTIEALIERCRRGPLVVEKAVLGVIGYGEEIRYEISGTVAELDVDFLEEFDEIENVRTPDGDIKELNVRRKRWIEAKSGNATPMAEALLLAATKLKEWISLVPDAPPPVVVNVTDGRPDDLAPGKDGRDTRAAARELRQLGGDDDACLLMCVHVGSSINEKVLFPDSKSAITGEYERLLFDISSMLPAELVDLATRKGLTVRRSSRLLAINASPEDLLRILDFGSSVAVVRTS